ncbi:hypothetical protein [Aulosira sp. FACHB-615]|uniref:hypothetical protein n=1 Tax=Aulosira sp. FACHB-615 TaxID=2692777 RepID=UPI00168A2451|nr:hypothetical protein [Aulosira sp. FACHB-615]MBD2487779.1 hypothetical protein [Aulosira sp. FACHB-615]
MDKIAQERDIAIARMSKIVDNLIQGNNLYEERLQKREIMQHLITLLDKFSPETIKSISDDELKHRLDSILVLEAVSGTLNDLTPEQIEKFDVAVNGR